MAAPMLDAPGTEWLVDAGGCDPARLRSRVVLASLFDRIIAELRLNPLGGAHWHEFPVPGGITGLVLLSESHLACHTFPERGFAAFDLYCCRPRERWSWEAGLREALGARVVHVRSVERGAAAHARQDLEALL